MKKLLCILTAICILAMTMGSIVMAEGEKNWALATNGATVEAEGGRTSPSGYNIKEQVINGNTACNKSNAWQSDGDKSTDSWVQVKLAQPIAINEISFYTDKTTSGYHTLHYSISGTEWTKVTFNYDATITASPYKATASLDGVMAQYIMVKLPTANYVWIGEIEVYGEIPSLPYLTTLTASEGTFTEAFDMNKTSYKLQIEDFENLPTLSYEKYTSDAQVAYTEASAENNYTATFAVTHEGETKEYTVQFVEYNWALSVNEAKATADTQTRPADDAIDGNDSTPWQSWSNDAKEGRWIKVEMKEPIAISKIRFTTTTSGSISNDTGSAKGWSMYYSLTGEDDNWTRVRVANITVKGSSPIVIEASFTPASSAKHVKVVYDDAINGVVVRELEVYGDKITDTYTTNCAISENVLTGNVTFYNKTEADENDKYYLMAVYVNGALYDVVPSNKSENSIAAGAAAGTKLTSSTLPSSGTVTAKLFVWDTPTTLVPVMEPIDLQ